MSIRALVTIVCLVCVGGWIGQQTTALKPHPLTAKDLQALRWIEGTWRGTGATGQVATAFDGKSITFEFVARQRGGYRWERVNDNAWRAVLMWPAASGKPAGERVYQLERIGKN